MFCTIFNFQTRSRSFKNGCYHELADQQQIGWHPNYKEKLKEDEKDV